MKESISDLNQKYVGQGYVMGRQIAGPHTRVCMYFDLLARNYRHTA